MFSLFKYKSNNNNNKNYTIDPMQQRRCRHFPKTKEIHKKPKNRKNKIKIFDTKKERNLVITARW